MYICMFVCSTCTYVRMLYHLQEGYTGDGLFVQDTEGKPKVFCAQRDQFPVFLLKGDVIYMHPVSTY